MKRILLTSTALVGLATAAAAEVTWSGAAVVGHNDEFEGGIYADIDIDLTGSTQLDNGVTATLTYGLELEDDAGAGLDTDNWSFDDNVTVSLTSDMAGFYAGDTTFAAENYWSGVSNMNEDGFSEADGEFVVRGEVMYQGVTAGLSYVVHTDDLTAGSTGTGELDQLSVGATAALGGADISVAYQEEADEVYDGGFNGDFNENRLFGLSVSSTFNGADVTLAYAQEEEASGDDESSIGVEVAYPVGPVTVTAFYVAESAVDDNYGVEVDYASGPFAVSAYFHDGNDEELGLNGSYDVGNGLSLRAGYIDEGETGAGAEQAEIYYVAGDYDLGGGASFTVSYAEVDEGPGGVDTALDEIGPNDDILEGTTVTLKLSF